MFNVILDIQDGRLVALVSEKTEIAPLVVVVPVENLSFITEDFKALVGLANSGDLAAIRFRWGRK